MNTTSGSADVNGTTIRLATITVGGSPIPPKGVLDRAIRRAEIESGWLALVHRFLDARGETWHYEIATRLALEVLLLALCALRSVTSWRSAVAQVVIGLVRLTEVWVTHQGRSVQGRAKEEGLIVDWTALRPNKAKVLRQLEAAERWGYWLWPTLVPMAQAWEAGSVALALALNTIATLARRGFDRKTLPAWRKSRITWRERV
jgi:hypothetical protein